MEKLHVSNLDNANEQAYTMSPNVVRALSALVNWVQKDALPRWLERGRHISGGWFSAHLSSAGIPQMGAPIQLVAQAQMLYLLARAEHVGWLNGRRKMARELIDFAGRHGTLPCRSDGYVRSLEAPSVVSDSRYDPLDHAWFVIANTACFAAFGEMSDLRRAYNILDWLHIHFADGVIWKGIDGKTDAPPELYRQMLRAFLYLAEVTQKPAWHKRAKTLYKHCAGIFYLPTISPLTTVDAVSTLEWREQLAWVRVLCRCERVLGVGLTSAETLYREIFAQGHLSAEAGEGIPGEVRAEAIAAGMALLAANVDGTEDLVIAQMGMFFRDYVVRDMPGVFIDKPWQKSDAGGSLATLVRLFDAALLAQQVLAKSSHPGS